MFETSFTKIKVLYLYSFLPKGIFFCRIIYIIKIGIKSEFGSSEYIAKFLRSCILWMQFIENLYIC